MRRVIIALSVLLAACGSSEKSTTIGGMTVTSDDSKGTASITTDKGTIRTAGGGAMANVAMPAFAPLYPGATVTGVIETETDGHKNRMVTFDTPDEVGKVADFYKAALAKAGWKLPSSFISNDSALLTGQKDGKDISIAISHQDDSKTGAIVTFPGEG